MFTQTAIYTFTAALQFLSFAHLFFLKPIFLIALGNF